MNFVKLLVYSTNFAKMLANSLNFVKLFANFANFVKCFSTSTNFIKWFAASTDLKVGFTRGNFHIRFDRLTFLEILYIMTTLLSGRYLQCFCITTTCL